jgi:hypothetical protein
MRGQRMNKFRVKKEYNLQLPTNYVDVNSEEMEKIEGGYKFDVSRQNFAYGVDVAIALASFGIGSAMTIKSFLAKKGATSGTQIIVKVATKAGIAKSIANNFGKAMSTVLGFTVGYGIAYLADRFDKSGLNNRVQF